MTCYNINADLKEEMTTLGTTRNTSLSLAFLAKHLPLSSLIQSKCCLEKPKSAVRYKLEQVPGLQKCYGFINTYMQFIN